MGFDYFDFNIEAKEPDCINKFKELYCSDLWAPEGMAVFCPKNDEDIKHIWRGGNNGLKKFQPARAVRIGWIKEVVENQSVRKIKINPDNDNIYFVSKKISKGTYYVVRCRYIKSKNKLRVYTAYLVDYKQVSIFEKWNDYDFGNKKSC